VARLYAILAGIGTLVVTLLAALGLAKRAGKKEAQAEQTTANLNAAKEASEIDSKVHDMPDPAVTDGLSKYRRD
jgi:hypothetical protein